MNAKLPALPKELKTFIDKGNTTFICEDGDWDLNLVSREKSTVRKELPARSLMIAENGSGDCLFLKASPAGKLDSKVFVYWHEENRSEVFAGHVKDLTIPFKRPAQKSKATSQISDISASELETALTSPDFSVRSDSIKQFAMTAFGPEAMPILLKALDNDWVDVVIIAAECIGKLGLDAMDYPTSQDPAERLMRAGSKVWDYSGFPNCYLASLEALAKIQADEDLLLEYIQMHIGLGDEEFLESLKVLKTIKTPEARDLAKRAAAFWKPVLNMKHKKQLDKILTQ